MMRMLCWLFAACAATTAPPPASPVAPAPPPAVAESPSAAEAPPDSAAPRQLAEATPPPVVSKPPPSPPAGPPAWQRYAVVAPPTLGRPTLAVVIDDMGLVPPQSARAVALPGAVTLSWMPYAPHLADQVAAATARGHEAMLHMPMEALGRVDPGPDTLRTWLPPPTNLANLRAALNLLPTAVALSQHDGSVAALSVPLMDLVMGELAARRMAFLDSPAIPHSVAMGRAEAAGVPAVARDLVIDTDPNPAAIRARLDEAEAIARRAGHAILIGHARPTTMDVLEPYLPALAARGFVLWPISASIAAEAHLDVGPGPAASAGATAVPPLAAVAPVR